MRCSNLNRRCKTGLLRFTLWLVQRRGPLPPASASFPCCLLPELASSPAAPVRFYVENTLIVSLNRAPGHEPLSGHS
jgi:hypothetical protein